MSKAPRLLLVSTKADFSLELFKLPESTEFIQPAVLHYNSSEAEIKNSLKPDYQFIYFRDPFNDNTVSIKRARRVTDQILSRYQLAYKVDKISSFDDMLFEDKWNQHQAFARFMPPTRLLDSSHLPDLASNFIKKRISARSKGVVLKESDWPSGAKAEDYIVQAKLDLKKEYRIYMVGGQIIRPMAIKRSKTLKQHVKLIGLQDKLESDLAAMCHAVYEKTKYDFIGLDVGLTKTGYLLLEVNRSPQFKAYKRLSSSNLAVLLNQYLCAQMQPLA